MKYIKFATTIDDLKLIVEDTKKLTYKMEIVNRPIHRDVLLTVISEELEVLEEFIEMNNLYGCIDKIRYISGGN